MQLYNSYIAVLLLYILCAFVVCFQRTNQKVCVSCIVPTLDYISTSVLKKNMLHI